MFAQAIGQAEVYQDVFITPPTTVDVIDTASALARTHGLQLWDCVVCAASAQAGAKALLTEDMQDGRILDGLLLINPFVTTNTGTIDALLAG